MINSNKLPPLRPDQRLNLLQYLIPSDEHWEPELSLTLDRLLCQMEATNDQAIQPIH